MDTSGVPSDAHSRACSQQSHTSQQKSKGKVAGFQKHVLLTGMVYDLSLEVADKLTWTMLLAFLTYKAID